MGGVQHGLAAQVSLSSEASRFPSQDKERQFSLLRYDPGSTLWGKDAARILGLGSPLRAVLVPQVPAPSSVSSGTSRQYVRLLALALSLSLFLSWAPVPW